MILAKEIEGELWIKAADYQRQKKEWVGLTDEEIDNCAMDAYTTEMANAMVTGVVNVRGVNIGIAKAIEAKLKEKNT